jgi:hypothetical protein
VRPGEERVVGTRFEVMPDVDNQWLPAFARKQREQLEDARTLRVAIDAVIFEDGTLIGEDRSELQRAFEKYLSTAQSIYRGLVARIDSGQSVDEAFQWLRTASAEALKKGPEDLEAYYYVQAAGDVVRARTKIDDRRVRDVLEQAIRKTPFAVRRELSK